MITAEQYMLIKCNHFLNWILRHEFVKEWSALVCLHLATDCFIIGVLNYFYELVSEAYKQLIFGIKKNLF